METFGERVKKLRKEKGIGVMEFSEMVGMTPDAVLKIESGKRGKTFEKLPKLAKALSCRIDDLFPGMDPDAKPVRADGFEDDVMEGWSE